MTTSHDAVDIPVPTNAAANYDSPWALEAQQQYSSKPKAESAATTSSDSNSPKVDTPSATATDSQRSATTADTQKPADAHSDSPKQAQTAAPVPSAEVATASTSEAAPESTPEAAPASAPKAAPASAPEAAPASAPEAAPASAQGAVTASTPEVAPASAPESAPASAPEAAQGPAKTTDKTGDSHTPAKEKTEQTPQDASYQAWYDATFKGKGSFQQSYDLATAYCQQYGDASKYHNEKEVTAISAWLRQQKERPCVEINVNDWAKARHTPTDEEIGVRIAKQFGFTDGEMCVYAAEHGYKTPGAAFYKSSDGHSGKTILTQAQHDPLVEGRVNIGEINPGAIASTKRWLKQERESNLPPNPINAYDYAKERTAFEAIFANIYNPVASAGDGLANTLGDIAQGVGLPAHLVTDRTFMDHFADWMRKKGDAMPMYDLYTDKEKDDAVVCLANIYGQAAGTAAPYLVTGGLTEGASAAGAVGAAAEGTEVAGISAKAYVQAARFAGTAQMSGSVYNSALDFQAQQIARQEAGDRQLSPTELAQRVDEIKEGKNIDAQKRTEIDRRALVAAVIAAPAGVIPGEYLEQLGALRSAGTPIAKMPAELMEKLTASAIKGGLIGTGLVVAGETAQVVAGVKKPEEAAQSISDNAPKVALAGAMIGATGELVGLTRVNPESVENADHVKPGLAAGDSSLTQSQAGMPAQGGINGRAIVAGESLVVGRADARASQVPIDKNTVSAKHCRVRLDAQGNYIISDLGSRNGTYINGQKLEPNKEYYVRPTDKVTLGNDTPLQLAPIDTVVQFGGVSQQLKAGQEIPIGRSFQRNVDSKVSRDHLRLGLDETGVYIVDSGSTNGTYLVRDGQQYKLNPNQKVYVQPTDKITLGSTLPGGGEPLTFSRTALVDGSALQDKIDALPRPENATSRIPEVALRQSNDYGRQHQISERLQDGWQNAGADATFDVDGNSSAASRRPAVVVDRQNDPVLRAVLQEAHERYGNLPPRERAEALTKFSKQLLTPEGWTPRQLDSWYSQFNKQHAGERVMLGDMIKGHKGVCSQQAILLKVMADDFPDMKATLVRGNSANSPPDDLNHAWTEFDFGDGKPLIFDPRQQVFGKDYKQYPHKPGRDIAGPLAKKPGRAGPDSDDN